MVVLVRSRVSRLQLLLGDMVLQVTFLAEIKVEAVIALVPHTNNGEHLAAMTLHELFYLSPGLNYELNFVSLAVVSSYLHAVVVFLPREVAVLTQAEVVAVGANKTGSDNRAHVTKHTLLICVCRKAISQQWKLEAGELMVRALNFARRAFRF